MDRDASVRRWQEGVLGAAALVRAALDLAVYLYLPLYAHEVLGEHRLRVLALIPVAASGVRFLCGPAWGRRLDRSGRPGAFLALGLGTYGLATALAARQDGAPGVLAAVALGAGAAAAVGPAGKALWTRRPGSLTGLSRWFSAESLGYVLGGLWLSLALGRWRWPPERYLDSLALAACAAGLAALLLPRGAPARRAPGGPPVPPGGSGLPGPVWGIFVAANVVWEGVYATYGVYLTRMLGVPTSTYGLLLSAATLIGAAAYPLAGRLALRWGGRRLLQWALATYAAVYAAIGSGVPALAAAANVVPCSPLLRMAVHRWALEGAGQDRLAWLLARLEAGEALAAAVGPPVGGWLADGWHPAGVSRLAALAAGALWLCARRLPGRG